MSAQLDLAALASFRTAAARASTIYNVPLDHIMKNMRWQHTDVRCPATQRVLPVGGSNKPYDAETPRNKARWLAMYITVNQFGITQADVARVAGCSRQAVSKFVRKIEDARDRDASLETALTVMGIA